MKIIKAYHGSINADLTELKPFSKIGSTIANLCVYMTTDKTHAALYIWDKPFYWFTYGFDERGRVHYIEYFPDALPYFYKGKCGAIYSCEGNFESPEQFGINNLVISHDSMKISHREIVEDVYSYLLHAEIQGLIKITRYNDLTENQKNNIENQVSQIKNDPNTNPQELDFVNLMF